MTRTLDCYKKVMASLPPDQRFLVQVSDKIEGSVAAKGGTQVTIQGPALLAIMQCMAQDSLASTVSLPHHIPGPLPFLNAMLQRGFLNGSCFWSDSSCFSRDIASDPDVAAELSVGADSGEYPVLWQTKLTAGGVEYATPTGTYFKSNKDARKHLATHILETVYPESYELMRRKQSESRRQLFAIRQAVARERRKRGMLRGAKVTEGLPAGEAAYSELLDCEEEGVEEEDTGVRLETYGKYVQEADLEEYVRGVAWVVSMYASGRCQDWGYTLTGPQAPSPELLATHLGQLLSSENSFDKERLRYMLASPVTGSRSLSATATAVCLVPAHRETEGVVTPEIARQSQLLRERLSESGDENMGYGELVERLQEVWIGNATSVYAPTELEGTWVAVVTNNRTNISLKQTRGTWTRIRKPASLSLPPSIYVPATAASGVRMYRVGNALV